MSDATPPPVAPSASEPRWQRIYLAVIATEVVVIALLAWLGAVYS